MEQYFHDPSDNPSKPPPDVYDLFSYYNKSFFRNVLEACELKWSKRMTSCAGLCYYSSSNSCTINLSQPLLQFRSNNELKETLLHEMIHAYLFLTNPAACQGGGHGKEFQYLMNFINEITNLNITIYHSFHDEVQFLQKHVWKCNGKCVETPPYFGIVRRAMNRAPGPNDHWWAEHEITCGGYYIKIDGPEFHQKEQKKPNEEKERKKKNKKNRKITEFLIKNTTNEESKILDTSSTLSTQGDCRENMEETQKVEESLPQIFRLKFIGYKDEEEIEILQLVLSDQIKFKELPLIISAFFIDFSLNDICFQHSELASAEPESTLLELIMIQGLTKITFIYMDLIEFSFCIEYVYDVTPTLNPSIGEAVNYPKVFGFKGEIGLFEDFLILDNKANINGKLCYEFNKKNNFGEESTTLNIFKSP